MKICAHKGFPAIAPENSLPAYGAAVALGLPVNIDCDDEETARQYAAWGVDTIVTNRMFAMKKLFG